MKHYLGGENLGLLVTKAHCDREFSHCFVTRHMSEAIFLSGTTGSNAMNLPLYFRPENGMIQTKRDINFDKKIFAEIRKRATCELHGKPSEVNVFDYIYGALHSPEYRSKYWQALSINFPHIPYPPSPDVFWDVSEKGGQLRRLHLMEAEAVGETPYPFTGEGDNVVGKPTRSDDGRVLINKTQYFGNVPEIAWNFYIGGYQPAQKWLKDRKGRALTFEDILHYQKIIKILLETDRIMKTIELPLDSD